MAKKNKKNKVVKVKKIKKKKDENEEDLDAMLQEFQKEQEEKFKVTLESNCPPPTRRSNCSFIANPLDSDELILFGGEYYNGKNCHVYNDFFKYSIEKKEWKLVTSPNSPGPRSGHQMVATNNGYLFLFGGEFTSPNETSFFHYKDFWAMDLKENRWEKLELKKRPSPRSGHRMTLWKHYIVLFGGFYDTGKDTKYFDDLWIFDTLEYQWYQLETLEKPPARSGFQFLSHGENIILYGGYSKSTKGQKSCGMVHQDCWMLRMNIDIKLIKWERRKKPSNSPSQRSGCTMVQYKGKGIMFGGVSDVQEDEETLTSQCHHEMYQFNLDGNKFYPFSAKKNEHFPCERFNSSMAVSKNTLYLFGGILEQNEQEITLNDLWAINLDKAVEWTCLLEDDLAVAKSQWFGDESSDSDSSDDEEMEDAESEVAIESMQSHLSQVSLESSLESIQVDDNQQHIPEPLPGETLKDYFSRSQIQWQQHMQQESNSTGKALRKDAFEACKEHFNMKFSENEQLRIVIEENDAKSHQTCEIHPETLEKLKQLRFRKDTTNACLILKIDTTALTVVEDEYLSGCEIEEIQDHLPDSTPRYLILSYKLNHADGRVSYPIVGVYYNPEASSMQNRMLYASTSQTLFSAAQVSGKVHDLAICENLNNEWLYERVMASKTRK